MGDILNGIYDVPRDARGRRLASSSAAPAPVEIAQPIEIAVNTDALVGTFDAATVTPSAPSIAYDPGDFTVSEVLAYATEHPDEIPAIIAAETVGKQRKMILGLA